MSDLVPLDSIYIQNDSGEEIPPRSIVVVTSVEIPDETDSNESAAIHHVEKYAGQAGNIFVTGMTSIPAGTITGPATSSPWWSRDKSYGQAYSDQFIYVAIDPGAPRPNPGEEWGPIVGAWYVGPTGKGFIAQGYPDDTDADRAMFYRAAVSSGGTSAPDNSCGCCDCFDCITDAQATVTTCSAAPDGAAFEYFASVSNGKYPELNGTWSMTYGVRTDMCDDASPSAPGTSGCIWTSCRFEITRGSDTGVYQFYEDMGVVPQIFKLLFVSGVDVVSLDL